MNESIIALISFLSAIFAIFITQIFTYSRDTRNLVLQKYDQSLSSLTRDIEMFLDYTSDIKTALKRNPDDIPKHAIEKLIYFGKAYRERKREEINFTIITSYDSSMTELVDQYFEKEYQLVISMDKIINNLAAFGKASSGNYYQHEKEYMDVSAKVIKAFRYRIKETMKHPFYKFIIGESKIPKMD